MKRIAWIDVLRGIAIMLMIPANLAYFWVEPHPMWFRILGSYPAPLFVMLSAGMVILTSSKHHFDYFLLRGGAIIALGALIDLLLWQITPLISFDILYLIGFSLPVIYLLRKLKTRELILIGILICLSATLLQRIFGYVPVHPDNATLWRGMFIDGWFPVFPWLGYSCFGAAFFRITFKENISGNLFLYGITGVVLGLAILFINGMPPSRFGFSEIFYPPTLAFALTLPGAIMVFTKIAQQISGTIAGSMLALFGRHSLLIYVLHQAFGYYVFSDMSVEGGVMFSLCVLLTVGFVFFVCIGLERIPGLRAAR